MIPSLRRVATATVLMTLFLGGTALAQGPSSVSAGDEAGTAELQPFPPAREGMQRLVITVPGREGDAEEACQMELVPGRELITDGVNRHRLGAAIEPRTLPGWGYTYYEVTGPGTIASTLMAPPEDAPLVRSFVAGEPLLIRCSNRLPIVVYAPAGYTVRYRVWTAPPRYDTAAPR